ncbi:MAG: hypothetical protein K2K44_07590 [Oscillospiraceae bacterium]|nr:hypothetical protein [Oscillospiraceae bacterium]
MKINNNSLWQWYIDFLFGGSSTKPLLKPKNKSIKNEDTVKISWQAKQDMRNDEIKKMIDSGEPLKGVTYEEFREYYRKYKTNDVLDTSRQGYIQALKGDKASLREKEWRTNPNYRVPVRLFSSPEVTADREAVLEKLRRNENLEEWETRLLNTFPNAYEGNLRENEARLEGQKVKYQNFISSALSEAGVELSEDDELRFEVWGYDMTVTGTLSDDKLELVKDKLADKALGFQLIYQRSGHRDEVEAGGLALVYLQSAEHILKEAGGGSVFDIGKDADGNFTGLPGDLSEFIKKNAIGKFGFGVDEKYKDREEDIKKALYMRETFNSVIKTVQNGDYNRLKALTSKLTYKNGILSC